MPIDGEMLRRRARVFMVRHSVHIARFVRVLFFCSSSEKPIWPVKRLLKKEAQSTLGKQQNNKWPITASTRIAETANAHASCSGV